MLQEWELTCMIKISRYLIIFKRSLHDKFKKCCWFYMKYIWTHGFHSVLWIKILHICLYRTCFGRLVFRNIYILWYVSCIKRSQVLWQINLENETRSTFLLDIYNIHAYIEALWWPAKKRQFYLYFYSDTMINEYFCLCNIYYGLKS